MAGEEDVLLRRSSLLCEGRKFSLRRMEVSWRGRRLVFDYLDHPGSVAVLAVDDKGRVLLERQYRPIVGSWVYEIPAGTREDGEEPWSTAVRELVEETGYRPGRVCEVLWFYPTPGVSNEVIVVYHAYDLEFVGSNPEEDEFIEVLWVGVDEAVRMIAEGKIVDGKTIVALLSYVQGVGKASCRSVPRGREGSSRW